MYYLGPTYVFPKSSLGYIQNQLVHVLMTSTDKRGEIEAMSLKAVSHNRWSVSAAIRGITADGKVCVARSVPELIQGLSLCMFASSMF